MASQAEPATGRNINKPKSAPNSTEEAERDKSRTLQGRAKGGHDESALPELKTHPYAVPDASSGEQAIMAMMRDMETRMMQGLQSTVKNEVI